MSAVVFSSLFEWLPIGGYSSETEMLAAVNDIGRKWYVEPERRAEFADRYAAKRTGRDRIVTG